MLEKVLSGHVLRYNDEGVYIRASSESAHDQIKPEFGAPTRSIYSKAITPKCEYLASGFLHNGLGEVLHLADMFDEFYSDLLYKLKCRFSRFKVSARVLVTDTVSMLPSFRLLQAFEVVLSLQLRNEGVVGSKLCVSGEALRHWRCDTVLLRLRCRHDSCANASVKKVS